MEHVNAYIAGLMDGEGSFSITWNKNQATTAHIVAIANTDLRLLEFVQQHFGGKIFTQSRSVPGARTTCYQWLAAPDRAGEFIQAIRPYLVAKGEQADVMLEYLPLRMHRITPEARKRRLELRERMLLLNKSKIRNQETVQLTGLEPKAYTGPWPYVKIADRHLV